MDLDLGKELGASEAPSAQRLTVYIPNKDKLGELVPKWEEWIDEARRLLTLIGGGTTALPPADGTWLDDDGEVLWEQTKTIYCYIRPDAFRAHLKQLRAFLHRFGQETKQGEVVVEFHIAKDGHLESAAVRRSSGAPILDEYSMRAVQIAAPFPPVQVVIPLGWIALLALSVAAVPVLAAAAAGLYRPDPAAQLRAGESV